MRKHKIVLTVVNIIIFILSVMSLIGTAKNNKKINEVTENFVYGEENGNVSLALTSGRKSGYGLMKRARRCIKDIRRTGKEKV